MRARPRRAGEASHPWLLLAFATLVGCQNPTGPEREISGERLYSQNCARCHGADGKGVPEQPEARDLSDRGFVDGLSDMRLRGVIRAGKPPKMPGLGNQLTDAALMVLVAHVRSLSGSKGARARQPGAE